MSTGTLFIVGMLGLMLVGLHVGSTIYLLGWAGDVVYSQILEAMGGTIAWNTMNEYVLVAIPLFIMVGEVLVRSGLADKTYSALAGWTRRLPGGLLHTNIAACTVFSATSGSSVATAATVGTVAIPALRERGYSERLTLGSIAAGGTLGILIPPSINMIIYAALTETSVGRLFAAGVVPGVLLAATMSGVILALAIARPALAGQREAPPPLLERLRQLGDLLPVGVIFFVIMGSIYGGLATPTEAAALALVVTLSIAAAHRRLSIGMLHAAFRATLRTTAMVMLVLVAAFTLNFILSLLGLPQEISEAIRALGLSPTATIWLLVLFYFILGCFMEAVAMMVTTIAIVAPLMVSMGVDLVWFGVFLTLLMELALITPPVGLNLYVVQGLRSGGSIWDVFAGVMPFVVAMLMMVAALIYLPSIALWLPNLLFG